MTTSSDHLAILLTLIIESKELSFLDRRSFASAKELKFLSKTNLRFVAAAAAGCEYGYGFNQSSERLHIRNIKTSKLKSNHIFNRTKKPNEVERLVVIVVVV
jgi:hypothetical protein